MYKGVIASGTNLTASTVIPFSPVITGCNATYNSDGTVSVNVYGRYNVYVSLPLTNASATPLTVQLYSNGTAISDAVSINSITASTGYVTFNISDVLNVQSAAYPNVAKLSVMLTGGTATTAGKGVFIIQKVG